MPANLNCFSNRVAAWSLLLLLVASGGIAGCATTKSNQPGDGGGRTLWHLRDQYVALEPLERPAGLAAVANEQPVEIPVARLRAAFDSVEARAPDSDRPVHLFGEDELEALSEHIHNGLLAASPGQDVTFAVSGRYPVLMGMLNQLTVTTGRVFCRDGEINIIFGDLLRYVKENEDRRLNPLRPGSRSEAVLPEWSLMIKPGGEPFALKRQDWIAFPIAPLALSAPTASGKAPAPAGRSIEERLVILNELRDKKLISIEEYRAKRLEILNEL